MKELFELLGKIRIDMTGFDDALKEVDAKAKTVEDKFTSVGEAASNVGGKMTKGITMPAIAAAGAAIKIGADFEESMSKVSALTGASEKEMSKLEDTARDLGKTTAFSAKEAADGMSFLGMAGFKTNEIVSAMPAVLDLAGAGQLDLADAADIASNVLSGFGMEASEAGHMANVLAKAATNANTDVGQLGEAMKYLAPMANSLGWEVEGSAAAIMALGDAGIQGSMAGQAFATSLSRLTDESGKAAKTAEELGMEFFDAAGNLKSMPELIAELEVGLEGMDKRQRAAALSAIFGAEAYKHWAVLLERGSEDLGKMEEGLINSKDAAKDMREEMEDNLKGDWNKFNSALQETAIVIYKNLQPALRKMVQSFTKVVEWLGNLSPAVQASIIKFVALLAVIGPLILIFGKFASAIGSIIGMTSTFVKAFGAIGKTLGTVAKVTTKVAPAFLKLGKSIKNLFSVARLIPLIFSPWGIAIAAALGFIFIFKDQIIALGKALWEFISGPVVEALGNIPSFIGDLITGLVDGIKSGLGAIWEAAKEIGRALIDGFKEILGIQSPSTVFRELGTWVIQGLIDGIKAMVDGVLEIIRFLVDAMIEDIKGLVDAYVEVFTNLKDAVIEIVGTMVEWVVTKITEFKDLIVEIVTELVGWFIDKFIELKDKVIELIIELVNTVIEWLTHLVQSIKEFAVEMVNAIVNAFNDMWDAASEFVSKAWELGRDFVMGIAEGIKNGVGWMKDAISFVVDSAIQWFKSKFDIRSPSRVMMGISEYIPMGVASGIEKRTPDVEYAMDKLSNKAIKQAKALANFNLSELFASGGFSKDATRKAILPKKGTARKLHNFGGAGAWDVPTDKKGGGSVTVNVRRLENANAKAIQNKVEKNFFKKARQRE